MKTDCLINFSLSRSARNFWSIKNRGEMFPRNREERRLPAMHRVKQWYLSNIFDMIILLKWVYCCFLHEQLKSMSCGTVCAIDLTPKMSWIFLCSCTSSTFRTAEYAHRWCYRDWSHSLTFSLYLKNFFQFFFVHGRVNTCYDLSTIQRVSNICRVHLVVLGFV